jgi:hypothetical protein
MEALSGALREVDPDLVKEQLSIYVPADVRKTLAGTGIRDEHVFPVPAVLEIKPTLIGYYRLLLGVPQKSFYKSGTGMAAFKAMEERGILSLKRRPDLEGFCTSMAKSLANLVRQISPQLTSQDVAELPLLALGSKFQGSNNNTIGKQATIDIFLAVSELVKDYKESETERKIIVRNSAGRKVVISLASDPDISIQEEFNGELRNKVAVEIKGGTDVSNAHNRAGEAEKSHNKAKKKDFRDFWTIIFEATLDMNVLRQESPTTTLWFDVAQVLARKGKHWESFRSHLADVTGIPVRFEI